MPASWRDWDSDMQATADVELCSQFSRKCATFSALLDSGADVSLLNRDAAGRRLGKNAIVYFPEPLKVRAANGQKSITAVGGASLQLAIDDCRTDIPRQFLVIEKLAKEVSIGVDLMEAIGVELTFRTGGRETMLRVKECPKATTVHTVLGRGQ